MTASDRLLYGRRTVESFLQTNAEADAIAAAWLQDSLPAGLRDLVQERAQKSGARIEVCARRDLDRRFPDLRHQGVVLELARAPDTGAAAGDWRNLIAPDAGGRRGGPFVLLDRLQDVQNVGGIIRSAEALGAGAVFVTGKGASAGETVHRVSAGASLRVPVYRESNLANVMETLKKNGYWICASAAPADLAGKTAGSPENAPAPLAHTQLAELPPAEDLALIIGSEGDGVKRLALERADYLISIPLSGHTSSLNAGVAAAILLDRLLHR